MIEVSLPDGSVAEFPDGTTHDVIKSALQKRFALTNAQSSGSDYGKPPEASHPADPRNSIMGKVDSAVRGAADALTFGFADEISAGLGTGFGYLGDYEKELARQRGIDQADAENRGGYRLAGEIGGTLAGASGLAKSGLTFMKTPAATMAGKIGQGMAEGAAYGAASGAGNAEGDGWSRVQGAFTGGGTGAAIGGVAAPAMSGLSALGHGLWNRIASHIGDPAGQAARRVTNAAGAAGVTADDIATKLSDLGPEAMLIDALGEPGKALGRAASNISPTARELLSTASSERIAGQPDRLTEALLRAAKMKEPQTIDELVKAARAKATPDINAAYNEARSVGHDIDMSGFKDIMKSGMAKDAFSRGQRLSRERMIAEGVPGDPSPLAILDEMKKSLDAMAEPALGKGPNNEQSIAGKLAETVRSRIDEWMPEYAGARQKARDLYTSENAIKLGADGAKSRVAADFGRKAADIAEADKLNLAQGYASGKIDQIENRRATPGVVDALFGSPRAKDALQSALGSDAQGVLKQIAAERAFGQTHNALTGNSTTARQLAEMGLGATAGFAYGGDFQSAGNGALAALIARKAGGKLLAGMTAKNEQAVAPIMAEILKGQELPKEVQKTLAKQAKDNPALRNLLLRSIAQQGGAVTAAGGW